MHSRSTRSRSSSCLPSNARVDESAAPVLVAPLARDQGHGLGQSQAKVHRPLRRSSHPDEQAGYDAAGARNGNGNGASSSSSDNLRVPGIAEEDADSSSSASPAVPALPTADKTNGLPNGNGRSNGPAIATALLSELQLSPFRSGSASRAQRSNSSHKSSVSSPSSAGSPSQNGGSNSKLSAYDQALRAEDNRLRQGHADGQFELIRAQGRVADKYFWHNTSTSSAPDLASVCAHLNTLTASDLQLVAASNQTRENVRSLGEAVTELADANRRLKRELREQRLSANKRWLWALVAFALYALGAPFLHSAVVACTWAAQNPHAAAPLVLDNLHVLTGWLWILAFPLVILLFVHRLLRSYGDGAISLVRTVVYLLSGLAMQVPLLWFVLQWGLVELGELRHTPQFASDSVNALVTLGLVAGAATLDYTLLLLHQHI